MKIAVVAPMIDVQEHNMNYRLRLKATDRELTLKYLYELFRAGLDPTAVPRDFSYEEGIIPAAGYYLEGALRAEGYETTLTNRTDQASLEVLAAWSPRVVCLSSTMILSRTTLIELVRRIRAAMPDVYLVVGGVFVWKAYLWRLACRDRPGTPDDARIDCAVFPACRSEIEVDAFVVAPHGMDSLLALLTALDAGSRADTSRVANLALPDAQGHFIFTERVHEAVDYDEVMTRWDLLDALPARVPIRTSVGCPFPCAYCDFPRLFGPRAVLRSPQSLARELQLVAEARRLGKGKPVMLHLTDDNVFINERRVQQVCDTIIESKLRLFWSSFMRAASVTPDNIELLKRSGLVLPFVGVESGDQGQLDRMQKRQRAERARDAIELMDAHGIASVLTFIVGYPGENERTVRSTIDFLNALRVSSAMYLLFPLNIMPLSELTSPALREKWGIEGLGGRWSHRTMDSAGAIDACHTIFRGVDKLPYDYEEESTMYNRRFDPTTRKTLFHLRHSLTVQVLDGAPAADVGRSLGALGEALGLGGTVDPAAHASQVVLPRTMPRGYG